MSTRQHDIEIDIAAPADQVWEAISTGDKIQQWFAPIAKVEPGVSIELGWSPEMSGKAAIRTWSPGKALSWVEGPGTESEKVVEFQLEPKDANRTTLRLVHTGFRPEPEFDSEYESNHGGWHTFFATLKHGLERFANKPARMVSAFRMAEEPKPTVWQRCQQHLNIDNTTEGAPYTARLGAYELSGTVLRAPREGYLCLSVDSLDHSPLSVFVEGGDKAMVTLQCTLYGDAVAQAPAIEAAISSFAEKLVSTGSSSNPA
ncbi:hypothetical protein F183_A33750 [Bryobacterales bacterium F-183]|nr:hypothetical protein F183_A33750 [Bryobacterales bacterium F-183]